MWAGPPVGAGAVDGHGTCVAHALDFPVQPVNARYSRHPSTLPGAAAAGRPVALRRERCTRRSGCSRCSFTAARLRSRACLLPRARLAARAWKVFWNKTQYDVERRIADAHALLAAGDAVTLYQRLPDGKVFAGGTGARPQVGDTALVSCERRCVAECMVTVAARLGDLHARDPYSKGGSAAAGCAAFVTLRVLRVHVTPRAFVGAEITGAGQCVWRLLRGAPADKARVKKEAGEATRRAKPAEQQSTARPRQARLGGRIEKPSARTRHRGTSKNGPQALK